MISMILLKVLEFRAQSEDPGPPHADKQDVSGSSNEATDETLVRINGWGGWRRGNQAKEGKTNGQTVSMCWSGRPVRLCTQTESIGCVVWIMEGWWQIRSYDGPRSSWRGETDALNPQHFTPGAETAGRTWPRRDEPTSSSETSPVWKDDLWILHWVVVLLTWINFLFHRFNPALLQVSQCFSYCSLFKIILYSSLTPWMRSQLPAENKSRWHLESISFHFWFSAAVIKQSWVRTQVNSTIWMWYKYASTPVTSVIGAGSPAGRWGKRTSFTFCVSQALCWVRLESRVVIIDPIMIIKEQQSLCIMKTARFITFTEN